MKDKIIKEGRIMNIILAILLIIAVVGFTIDESNDNIREGQYKKLIDTYESRYVSMANGGTQLYRMYKECRDEVEVLNG